MQDEGTVAEGGHGMWRVNVCRVTIPEVGETWPPGWVATLQMQH